MNHPIIMLINQKSENMDHFSLKASISKTEKELMEQLNSNKATTFGNISTRILKQSTKSCSDTLHKLFNDGLWNGNFTDKLKCTNTTPVSNKDDPKSKKINK